MKVSKEQKTGLFSVSKTLEPKTASKIQYFLWCNYFVSSDLDCFCHLVLSICSWRMSKGNTLFPFFGLLLLYLCASAISLRFRGSCLPVVPSNCAFAPCLLLLLQTDSFAELWLKQVISDSDS